MTENSLGLDLICLFWLIFSIQVLFFQKEEHQRIDFHTLEKANNYLLKTFLHS